MTLTPVATQVLGAFLTGLAASVHCFGMCGGLQAALAPGTDTPGLWRLQLGRTAAYVSLGAMAGGLSGVGGHALAVALGPLAGLLRWVAVSLATVALLALAFRLLARRDVLGLEHLGTRLWRLVQPLGRLAGGWAEPWRSFALGGVWAFIPCALVLSMAALAATTGTALRGAALMGAFALGTWPALLGAAAFGRGFSRLDGASPVAVRIAVATGLLLLAVAQVSLLLAPAHHHRGPAAESAPESAGHEHHHHAMP